MKSMLVEGWGRSTITISDVDENSDLSTVTNVPRDEIYSVVDGAHRVTAIRKIMTDFPNHEKWKNFKLTCSYVGPLPEKDRIAFAYCNIFIYF